jgi:pilus assembly protein CpaE
MAFYVLFIGVSPRFYLRSDLPLIYYRMNSVHLTAFRHLLGKVVVPCVHAWNVRDQDGQHEVEMRPTTILLAEDNRISARLVEKLLTVEGYTVQVAGDGQNAFMQARGDPPDLVISDVMMPGMDGYELCRQLRSNPSTSSVPVILLTAKGGVEEKRRGFEAGADDYLVKPADPVELRLRVSALLARSQSRVIGDPTRPVPSKVIAVFSLRGGAGVTSLATNLAVALAQRNKVAVPLVDLDLLSGLDSMMLNLNPANSWVDLARYRDALNEQALEDCLSEHDSGVKLLSAPPVPTTTSYVSPGIVSTVLSMLRTRYSYTVVDSASDFSDITFAALDAADTVILPCPPDPASMKVTRTALGVLASLGYADQKLLPIINCAFGQQSMPQRDIEATLGIGTRLTIPHEPQLFMESINQGKPFVWTHPHSPSSLAIGELSQMVS